MLLVGSNLFMGWSDYLIFNIQWPLIWVKIKVSSDPVNKEAIINYQTVEGKMCAFKLVVDELILIW
jgi:hypothetical protein